MIICAGEGAGLCMRRQSSLALYGSMAGQSGGMVWARRLKAVEGQKATAG
ncbi:MAG: hypothetical protein ACLVKK_08345 [Ruthenibacterium sp.]